MFPFVFLQNKLIIVSPLENYIKGFNYLCILNMPKIYENKHFEIEQTFCNSRNVNVDVIQTCKVMGIHSLLYIVCGNLEAYGNLENRI